MNVKALLAAGMVSAVLGGQAETILFDFETEADRDAVANCKKGACRLSVTNAFATSGGNALLVEFPASQGGWPSFTLRPSITDWSEYDRIAIDFVSLSDTDDYFGLKIAGPDGRVDAGVNNTLQPLSKGYKQWVVPLAWKKSTPSNNITRVHFNTHSPKTFSVVIDRLTLLKKGEEPTAPHGEFFISEIMPLVSNGAAEFRQRLDETEHESDYQRFRAACYRDGVKSPGMLLGKATSMEKILPRDRFEARPLAEDGLGVRLARSEYESVQLLVAADGADLKGVRLKVEGDLAAEDGSAFAASNVECHVMGYVKTEEAGCKVPCTRPKKGGCGYVRELQSSRVEWWPDPILGFLDGIDIKGRDIQSFWIRVHCPEGQVAGRYAGTLLLSADGVASVRIPFAVRVNGFSIGGIPSLPTIVSCGSPHPCVKDRSAESKAEVAAIRKDPLAPCNLYKKRLDDWIDFFADYGITHDHLYKSSFNSQAERAVMRLKKQGRLGLVNLHNWNQPKEGEDIGAWRERYFPAMSNAYAKAKSLGILDRVHFYGCDEVPKEKLPLVREAVLEIKKAFPGVPVSTTAVDLDYGVGSPLDVMDWFCPLTNDYDPKKAEASRRAGHKVWWYVCCGPVPPYANMFVECSAIEARSLMGAQAVKFKPDGFLYYQTVMWNARRCIESGPFTDWNPRSFHRLNGDGSWACAGPGCSPVPTIRMENFRDGLEDYAYAKILEEKLAVHADKNDDWSRKAKALLAVPREVVDTLENFNDDPASLYRWRDAMADLIAASPAMAKGNVASVVDVGGVPRFAIDGKPMTATAVMPSPAGKPGEAHRQLKAFRDAGVLLSSDVWTMHAKRYNPRQWWLGEGEYDFALFDALAKGLVDAAPDGFIFPRIKIDPPQKWCEAHPDEMMNAISPHPESKAWRALYRRMLKDIVAHVEASSYADRVIGYHLGAFSCGEWLTGEWRAENRAYIPSVPCGEDNPFPPAEVTAVRRAVIEGRANAVADMLIDAASCVKELTGGRKLVGAFFGYPSIAHEKVSRVIRSGKVDFFAAPPVYLAVREPGHSGRSQAYYQASYRLHGRVYYEESDFRTFLSDPAFSPPRQTRRRPLDESVGIVRRTIGKCLAGGWENWWFLLGGNDTFAAPELMESIRIGAKEERDTLFTARWKPAEVAVFTAADEYATSAGTHALDFRLACTENLHCDALPACGVPFDSYELSDIADPRLPEYKVYVFPNAFTLSGEMRGKIKERVFREGKTAVWIYRAPEGFEKGCQSVVLPLSSTAAELRKTFRAAGAHVWIDTDDVLAAGRGYVMVHAATDGEKTVCLPNACVAREIFGASPAMSSVTTLSAWLKRGETRVWRLF